MKKNFENLQPKKRKPSDEQIEQALSSSPSAKQKSIQYTLRLPENLHDKIQQEARKMGLTKKSIIVSALWEKFK